MWATCKKKPLIDRERGIIGSSHCEQQWTCRESPLCTACAQNCRVLSDNLTYCKSLITFSTLEIQFDVSHFRTVMLDNKGKKDKSKVVRRPTPTAPHRPSINTSSSSLHSELGPGRGNHVPQRSLSPATSRPHPALMARSRPSTSPSTQAAASWRSPSSAQTPPDLSQHAKSKAAFGGHKSKSGSVANPEIMKRSLRWEIITRIKNWIDFSTFLRTELIATVQIFLSLFRSKVVCPFKLRRSNICKKC